MDKNKHCYICKKIIFFEKEKYVLLGTYNISKNLKQEEDYFHFECFRQWQLDKTKERTMNMLNQVKEHTMKTIMPIVNNTLKQFQNNETLQATLKQLQPTQTFEILPNEKFEDKKKKKKKKVFN